MSSLEFHPLTFVPERDGVTVGRADTTSYVQLPPDGAELLRQMSGGMPTEKAATWYQEKFGEPVDIADFVDAMRECGFVRDAGELAAQAPSVRFERLGRAAFSPAAWLIYAVIIAAACFEQLDALLSVPPRRRYLVILAGMLADILLYAALVLFAAALYRHGLPWPGRLALALGYTILLRLAWQFYVFLRTDLYHVLTTALGCVNLHEASREYLRQLLRRPARENLDGWSEDVWSGRDRRAAPWFLLLTFVGGIAMIATAVFGALPVIVQFAERAITGLEHGGQNAVGFWSSAASVL